jgi:hypothetical protein
MMRDKPVYRQILFSLSKRLSQQVVTGTLGVPTLSWRRVRARLASNHPCLNDRFGPTAVFPFAPAGDIA